MEQPAPPSYIEVVTNPSYSISPPLDEVNQNDPESPASSLTSSVSEDEGPTDELNDSSSQNVSEDLAETTRLRSNDGADANVTETDSATLNPTFTGDREQPSQNAANEPLNDNEPPPPSYEEVFIYPGHTGRPIQVQRTSASNVLRDSAYFTQPPPSYNAVVNTSHGAHFNPGFSNTAQSHDSTIVATRPLSSNYATIHPGSLQEQTYTTNSNGNYNNQGYQRMPYMGNTSTSTTAGTGSYIIQNTNEQSGVSTPTLVVYNADNPSTSTSSGIQGYNTTPLAYVDPNAIPSEKSTTSRLIPLCFCILVVFIPLVFYLSVF